MRIPFLRILLATTLLAGTLVGCGGTPSSDPKADAAIARSALLPLSALPAGWTASVDTSPEPSCPAIKAAERNPKAESDRFEGGDDASAQHEVIVLTTTEAANSAFDALVERVTLDCIAQQTHERLASQAPAGSTVGEVHVDELNVPGSGDRTVGARIAVPLATNGVGFEVYEDIVFSRVGRGLSLVAVVSKGVKPPDARLPADLARRGAQRLRGALAAG